MPHQHTFRQPELWGDVSESMRAGVRCRSGCRTYSAALDCYESLGGSIEGFHCCFSATVLQVLKRIRGTDDVDEELEDIKAACRESNKITNPWAEIMKYKSRPQLFVALTATFFQQWTGINTVIFYGEQHAPRHLLSAVSVITGRQDLNLHAKAQLVSKTGTLMSISAAALLL